MALYLQREGLDNMMLIDPAVNAGVSEWERCELWGLESVPSWVPRGEERGEKVKREEKAAVRLTCFKTTWA